jgi:hypothetical protein
VRTQSLALARSRAAMELAHCRSVIAAQRQGEAEMGRYLLLWLLGVPIPILILIWAFGGLS